MRSNLSEPWGWNFSQRPPSSQIRAVSAGSYGCEGFLLKKETAQFCGLCAFEVLLLAWTHQSCKITSPFLETARSAKWLSVILASVCINNRNKGIICKAENVMDRKKAANNELADGGVVAQTAPENDVF